MPFPFRQRKAMGVGMADREQWPNLRVFILADPGKASRWFPAAAFLKADTIIAAAGRWPGEEMIAIPLSELSNLHPLPQTVPIDSFDGFAYLTPGAELSTVGVVVPGFIVSHRMDTAPIHVVHQLPSKMLVPDFALSEGMRIPASIRPLPAHGTKWTDAGAVCATRPPGWKPTLFYKAADLFPSAKSPASVRTASDAAVEARCMELKSSLGVTISAKSLLSLTRLQFEETVHMFRLRSEGWLSARELAQTLNLAAASNVPFVEFTERFVHSIPEQDYLYRPFSIDDLIARGMLTSFLEKLCPNGKGFLLQCIASDRIRSAVVAESISAG